jgi:putative toxin-antitoxin system antitoxin component (TIGR02293 family)
MGDVSRIAKILGGEQVLGTQLRSPESVEALKGVGVPMASAFAVADRFHLRIPELVSIMGAASSHAAILLREYEARNERRPGLALRLNPVQSASLIGVATLLAHAQQVFESDSEIAKWLRAPQSVLDGHRPIALLGHPHSRQAVDDVLTRIEHGVFA